MASSKPPSQATTTKVPSFHDTRTRVPEKDQMKVIFVPAAIDLLEESKGNNKDLSQYPPIISTSRGHSHLAESTEASSEGGGGSTICAKTTLVHPLMIIVQLFFSGEETSFSFLVE